MKTQANPEKCDGGKSRWSIRALFGRKRSAKDGAPDAVQPEPALPADARRILVVDDDEVIRTTTAMKLKSCGYAVTTAADGPSAIHAARCERPDLILLDLGFPPDVTITWDGFSIMKWLRRLDVTKDIPIIILTSNREPDLPRQAQTAGAEGVFNKPLNFAPLFGMIEARLRQHGKLPCPARA